MTSSRGKRRTLVIGPLYPRWRPAGSRIQLGEGALDLGVLVERLQPLAFTPFVACPDELADLLDEAAVVLLGPLVGLDGEQPGELRVDVQGRLTAALAAVAAGAEHLADLLLALGPGGRGAGLGDLAGGVVAFAREAALADLVVEAVLAPGDEEQQGHHER